MINLKNRTALVTGASRGQAGRPPFRWRARRGARVLVHYGRSRKDAEDCVANIRAASGSAEAIAADLAARDGPHALAAQVRELAGSGHVEFHAYRRIGPANHAVDPGVNALGCRKILVMYLPSSRLMRRGGSPGRRSVVADRDCNSRPMKERN